MIGPHRHASLPHTGAVPLGQLLVPHCTTIWAYDKHAELRNLTLALTLILTTV